MSADGSRIAFRHRYASSPSTDALYVGWLGVEDDPTDAPDFLTGHLDDILGELTLNFGSGSHLLQVSDEASVAADMRADGVGLMRSELVFISDPEGIRNVIVNAKRDGQS